MSATANELAQDLFEAIRRNMKQVEGLAKDKAFEFVLDGKDATKQQAILFSREHDVWRQVLDLVNSEHQKLLRGQG